MEGDAANDVALLGYPLGVFGFPLIAVTDDDVVRTGAYLGGGSGADERLERQLANGAVPAPGYTRIGQDLFGQFVGEVVNVGSQY